MITLAERPLAAFDVESSGVDPMTDRIVTANLTLIDPRQNQPTITSTNWLLNPEIEIPQGATDVHGISSEHAREHGMDYEKGLSEIGSAIMDAWNADYALVVYNASFDMTMLHHECMRVFDTDLDDDGSPIGFPVEGSIIDPFVIDKAFDQYRKGKRTLGAACEHYNVALGNAHNAEDDAVAAARLAWVMLRRYGLHTATHDQIMREQTRWYAEQADGLARYWRKKARSLAGDEKAELLARADNIRTEWPIAHNIPVPA